MTALTAFELLIKCERALASELHVKKTEALRLVCDTLKAEFIKMLTPEKNEEPSDPHA